MELASEIAMAFKDVLHASSAEVETHCDFSSQKRKGASLGLTSTENHLASILSLLRVFQQSNCSND